MVKNSLYYLWNHKKYKEDLHIYFKKIYPLNQNEMDEIMKKDDITIYKFFFDKFSISHDREERIKLRETEQQRSSTYKIDFLSDNFDIKNKYILDIGTEDCFYIDKLNKFCTSYGINVESHEQYSYHSDKSCIKIYDGKNIPFKDNEFDIITIYMVLHHITNIDDILYLLNDAKRVLKPNGVLLLREHDFNTEFDEYYIDFIHYYYELSFNADFNEKYYKTYEKNYMSKYKLREILKKIGYVCTDNNFKKQKVTIPKTTSRAYYTQYKNLK